MYTIPIHHNGDTDPTVYKVYKKKEADKESIEYKYWKDANIGEYGITDDEYVAKVINKKAYDSNHKEPNIYIRYPWGYTFFNPNYASKQLHAMGRQSNQTFTGKPHLEVMAKQDVMKNLALMYSLKPDPDLAIDWVFDSISTKKRRKFKRIMRTEVFQSMVKEQLQELLTEHGLTENFTLDLLDETISLAKEKKDITNLLKAVDNLQEMHGMKDKHLVKTIDKLEATSSTRLLDEIIEEEKSIKIQQTTEKADE
tara:strand:- start:16238 stop:16999 length:762 start_codon:yes stop_codon:yes gene_type:complete